MKYIKQFLIILLVSFLGELFNLLLPLPIPGSVWGMLLLYLALLTGIIKLPSVKETGKFLVEIMPILFVPAGVGLLNSWGILQPMLLPIAVALVVNTVLVMVVSGRVTQAVMRLCDKKRTQEEHGDA